MFTTIIRMVALISVLLGCAPSEDVGGSDTAPDIDTPVYSPEVFEDTGVMDTGELAKEDTYDNCLADIMHSVWDGDGFIDTPLEDTLIIERVDSGNRWIYAGQNLDVDFVVMTARGCKDIRIASASVYFQVYGTEVQARTMENFRDPTGLTAFRTTNGMEDQLSQDANGFYTTIQDETDRFGNVTWEGFASNTLEFSKRHGGQRAIVEKEAVETIRLRLPGDATTRFPKGVYINMGVFFSFEIDDYKISDVTIFDIPVMIELPR